MRNFVKEDKDEDFDWLQAPVDDSFIFSDGVAYAIAGATVAALMVLYYFVI